MMVFGITLVLFLGVVLAMSVGMIVAGRRLRGSCGGITGSSCGKCSPAKQAKCKTDSDHEINADIPIPPSALNREAKRREANLPSNLGNRRY